MALTGNLETFYLTTILQLLHTDQKTGILQVMRNDEEIKVYVQGGSIIHATRTQEKNRLGDLLVKHGIITEKQLKECLKFCQMNKQPLGKVVVEKEYATPQALKQILFKQAENAIYDLLLWKTGKFEYQDKPFSTQGLVIRKINIMRLILEASRRIDEISILKKQIPDEEMIFKLTGNVRDDRSINLSPDEWSVLALIDGKSNVRNVCRNSVMDQYSVYKILNSLISAGCIKASEELSPALRAQKAYEQIKNVDSKTIRELFDTFGLPRSSLLRLIFTRIIRDAVSPEDLMDMIDHESKKISQVQEIETLARLNREKHVPFMEDIIALLMAKADNAMNGQNL
ncbi:MAG: DUF4388 domain-containing protein [Desulfobacteraceae bacterium]|nr:MAG: DUF4388 domain-containing protein [Desulfobacteraceae bacterium]